MYLVMMTLQSGCFGVIFECSKPYKKSVFSVSILSVKVKIVDERKTKKQQRTSGLKKNLIANVYLSDLVEVRDNQ